MESVDTSGRDKDQRRAFYGLHPGIAMNMRNAAFDQQELQHMRMGMWRDRPIMQAGTIKDTFEMNELWRQRRAAFAIKSVSIEVAE